MAAAQKRVLVVDDALDIARLLRGALGAADPNLVIQVFPSAEEAIFASAREQVHLLISDIRLPGISGADLVHRIRAANPHVKVILITGLNQEQIDAHVNGLPVDGFFHKPFEVTEFVALAQRCLQEAAAAAPPPEKPVSPRKPGVHAALERPLRELRAGANAAAAWLHGADGAYLAGVGDLPTNLQGGLWGQAVTASMGDQPAVASLLGSAPQQRIMTLRGGSQDLILAAQDHVILVLLLQKGSSPLRLALAFEEILRLLPVITAAAHNRPAPAPQMAELSPQVSAAALEPASDPVPLTPPVSAIEPERLAPVEPEVDAASAPEDEADLSALISLLDQKAAPPTGVDLDAFWETLADSSGSAPPAQTISYEEARRLGLSPNDDAEQPS